MENQSPSLGDQIARLRGTAQRQEKCAWLPAPVHALIMACLARIFGRLEQIFLLFQSGDFPLPPPHHPAPRQQDHPLRPPARRNGVRPARIRVRLGSPATAPGIVMPARHAAPSLSFFRPTSATPPRQRARSARAPPA